MNYRLQGHDRNNAVQDMLICLLPDETHVRLGEGEAAEGTDICESRLFPRGAGLVAQARVVSRSAESQGEYYIENIPKGTNEYKRDQKSVV